MRTRQHRHCQTEDNRQQEGRGQQPSSRQQAADSWQQAAGSRAALVSGEFVTSLPTAIPAPSPSLLSLYFIILFRCYSEASSQLSLLLTMWDCPTKLSILLSRGLARVRAAQAQELNSASPSQNRDRHYQLCLLFLLQTQLISHCGPAVRIRREENAGYADKAEIRKCKTVN